MSNPRTGICLCGEPATIRKTKAEDGRLHFVCHDLTGDGKAKHYGFVDRSEAERLEIIEYDGDEWVPDEESSEFIKNLFRKHDDFPDQAADAMGDERTNAPDETGSSNRQRTFGRFGFPKRS